MDRRLLEKKEGFPYAPTEKDLAQVEALAAVLTINQVADYFGVSAMLLQKCMKNIPELDKAYKKGRAKAIAIVGRGLLQSAMDGDNTARMFYLKTKAGWRETVREGEADDTDNVASSAHQNIVNVLIHDKQAENIVRRLLRTVTDGDSGVVRVDGDTREMDTLPSSAVDR